MAEIKEKESGDVKSDNSKKKKFKIEKTDFKFNGVRYKEGSVIELTDAEYEAEKGKLVLTPVK